ncbi:MAG TPA: TetR/AcrR family transcriptional regulator, partial [Puia sp.]
FQSIVHDSLFDKIHQGCFAVNACVENAPDDKTVTRIVNENMRAAEEFFYQAIKKGQETGEISSRNDARTLARFIVNTINGIRVSAKAGLGKEVYEDIVKVALSVLD